MSAAAALTQDDYWGVDIEEMSAEQLTAALGDAYWRIWHLYWILDKDGETVLFQPNEVQDEFIRNIWYRNVVPKARQRGFSTVVQIIILDACLFNENIRAGIIAQDRDTAEAIFSNKIKFAYDRLPPVILAMVTLTRETTKELHFSNGSMVRVATSFRGGTINYLHVSEFGKICQKYPEKAKEIIGGSLPAVPQTGVAVVESTVEGIDGYFTKMVRQAEKKLQSGARLGKMDYRLHFASWWDADEYETDPDTVVVSQTDNAYFTRMEGLVGIDLPPEKRAWYVAMRDNDFGGDQEEMWRQFPTTLEEAFTVSTEGTWLADQLARCRAENRVTTVAYDPALPVNTFWDIGVGDDVAIWLHQQSGPRNHFIGFIEACGEPYAYYVSQLQALGYVWGRHYLPHDADHRRPGAEVIKTDLDMLHELGLRNLEIVPRTADLESKGIQQLRNAFASYWFDEAACKEGLDHLAGYKKVWNNRHSLFTSQVAKNGHQHAADAIRQHAQMASDIRAHTGTSTTTKRPKRKRRGGMAA